MLKNKIKKYYASQELDESKKRLIAANLNAVYGDNIGAAYITSAHSTSKKSTDDDKVYAKGPGLWSIGAAAAAIALIAGASFFMGGSGNTGIQPGATPSTSITTGQPSTFTSSDLTKYPDDYYQCNIEVVGYEKNNKNQIKVDSLNNGDELTVRMQLGEYDDTIISASFNVFLDGYVALDPETDKAYDEGCLQFFSDMGSGEFVRTEEGVIAEYTFEINGISDVALPDNTFTIIGMAFVDYERSGNNQNQGEIDCILSPAIYNTAYEDISIIDKLEEMYKRDGIKAPDFRAPYDELIAEAGYYINGESNAVGWHGMSIVDPTDGSDPYISLYKKSYADRKYLFEDAYYTFIIVDNELTPLKFTSDDKDAFVTNPMIDNVRVTDDGSEAYIYNPIIQCIDTKGNARYFYYQLGSDVSSADVHTVPVIPYTGDTGGVHGAPVNVN